MTADIQRMLYLSKETGFMMTAEQSALARKLLGQAVLDIQLLQRVMVVIDKGLTDPEGFDGATLYNLLETYRNNNPGQPVSQQVEEWEAALVEALTEAGLIERFGPRPDPAVLVLEIMKGKAEKDSAYCERNKLVAALSKLFPASLERHQPEDDDWDDDWRWVVFIELPTGQVSWHIHDSELSLFGHLRMLEGRVWDGHSTDEKYLRLAGLLPIEME